jgi:hypothetical protein
MDSIMVTIDVDAELFIQRGAWGETNNCEIVCVYCISVVPSEVAKWIESDLLTSYCPTQEELDNMEHYIVHKVEFEVEVWYREIDGKRKATEAQCQVKNVPNFVSAWFEQEAMKRIEEGGCLETTHRT